MKYNDFKSLINEIRDEITINTEDLSNIDGDSKLLLDISNKNNLKIEKNVNFHQDKRK